MCDKQIKNIVLNTIKIIQEQEEVQPQQSNQQVDQNIQQDPQQEENVIQYSNSLINIDPLKKEIDHIVDTKFNRYNLIKDVLEKQILK